MKPLTNQLSTQFEKALLQAFPELRNREKLPIEVVQSTQDKFGHYQCNTPMKLAKELKLNPRQIAETIIQNLPENKLIKSCEIAGPGFINIHIREEFLSELLDEILRDEHLGIERPQHPLNIIIDFSSPNTAKEMHVGHLRSTIIGDCLANVFEFLGHHVMRLNHIGDWGTAFGMLIAYIKKTHPQVLEGTEATDLSHLAKWYKESKLLFDSDAEFKKSSQLQVVALQGGDERALKAWQIICDISRKSYQEIYDLLGVELVERGESFYNPRLLEIIQELEAKELVTISDGAKCIFLEGFQNREGKTLPLMIQKSDGGFNYDTTDMAAIRQRIREEKADRIIYVTDAGQNTHFRMIFKAAEKAGYLDPQKVRVDHVGFGLVLGADGKKLKTRSGHSEKLIDLLTSGIEHAEEILAVRDPDLSTSERKKIAKALGLGAIKYADLSSHRMSDYQFSYEKMLRFEGNTAAFIMYSYVRVGGIKRKVNADIQEVAKKSRIALKHPSEIALGITLAQFSEALNQLSEDLLPNRLTEYLYNLAEKFNAFFRDCRVEGSQEQDSRLLLCELVAKTLKQGLELLGINPVEKM